LRMDAFRITNQHRAIGFNRRRIVAHLNGRGPSGAKRHGELTG